MKVLMINKFLHPNGGSETYIFKLGEELIRQGHEVQYFGMEHEGRCVGNFVDAYTSNMDFHDGSKMKKIAYPLKTIYSKEARKKIRAVLDDFQPDVCHLNNFNYQITPSVILEIVKWRKINNISCKIVYTAHDYQLVCPNHMCNNPNTHENCEKCLNGHFLNCAKNKCIHSSFAKSVIGSMEASFWKLNGVYKYIDVMICCSEFMKTKLDYNKIFSKKTIVMLNFIEEKRVNCESKKDYVIYFGRMSKEKGIDTLIKVCKRLPQIKFVFAGTGPLANQLGEVGNIEYVGFKVGNDLEELISNALFSIYPSEWYENCPFSVMESQMLGTPVLGANIGGIPELIKDGITGEIYESGNDEELEKHIYNMYSDTSKMMEYSKNCLENEFCSVQEYVEKLIEIYSVE